MKKLTSIFFILILLLSCTSRTIYKKPKNLIEKEQMINLWTDIFIAKGTRSIKTKDLRKNINYIPLVFKKYNIDSVQFNESNTYYTSKIDEYKKMFEEVEKRLEVLKEQYKPQKDSIKPILLLEKERDTLKGKRVIKDQRLLENTMN
jgi:hypothetical protein